MSLLTLSARLDRSDSNTTWGFRLAGGKDFGAPLQVQRVTPGSLAAKCGVQTGDTILKIGGTPADNLRHKEAQQQIILSGNSLELFLQRSGGAGSLRPQEDEVVYKNPSRQHAPAPAPAPVQNHYAVPYQNAAPPAGGGFRPVQQPQNYPTDYQDFNTTAQPYSGSEGLVPLAQNRQYNTPINMYSVNNVMNSLATQTSGMNISGQPQQAAIPPWQSAPSQPPAPASPAYQPYVPSQPSQPSPGRFSAPAPAPAPAPAGGSAVWKPKVPTGPRKMKLGKVGDARSMPATAGSGRIPVCSSCHTSIRGPFVLALDKSWCPDHFICANPHCRCDLVGIGFVEEEGQLFCERDYEQYFAPRCGKCGCAIMGDCVNALKDTFCPRCFLCAQCRTPIGTGSFHMEDGKVYCEKDWQAMFQTKCYGCQFPIEPGDKWVEALTENWHSECFNCSTCQMNLEGQSFFAKAGRPYCKKHAMGR